MRVCVCVRACVRACVCVFVCLIVSYAFHLHILGSCDDESVHRKAEHKKNQLYSRFLLRIEECNAMSLTERNSRPDGVYCHSIGLGTSTEYNGYSHLYQVRLSPFNCFVVVQLRTWSTLFFIYSFFLTVSKSFFSADSKSEDSHTQKVENFF